MRSGKQLLDKSLADIVMAARVLGASDEGQLLALFHTLEFRIAKERQPAQIAGLVEEEARKIPETTIAPTASDPAKAPISPEPLQRISREEKLLVKKHESVASVEAPARIRNTEVDIKIDNQLLPFYPLPLLLTPGQIRSLVIDQLSVRVYGKKVDVGRLTETVALLRRMPVLPRVKKRAVPHMIRGWVLDCSIFTLYRPDLHHIVDNLNKIGLGIQTLTRQDKAFPGNIQLTPGETIVLVTDFGLSDHSHFQRIGYNKWQDFLVRAQEKGVRLIGLVPFVMDALPDWITNNIQIIPWISVKQGRSWINEVSQSLANYLSVFANPGLPIIRALRQRLFPISGLETEWILLQSSFIASYNNSVVIMDSPRQQEIWHRLSQHPPESQRVWDLHNQLRVAYKAGSLIRLEEDMMRVFSENLLQSQRQSKITDLLLNMLALLNQEKDHPRVNELLQWGVYMLSRLPREVQVNDQAKLFKMIYTIRLGANRNDVAAILDSIKIGKKGSGKDIKWALPQERVLIGLSGGEGKLIFNDPPKQGDEVIEVPSTYTRVILIRETSDPNRVPILLEKGQSAGYEIGNKTIELLTLSGESYEAGFEISSQPALPEEEPLSLDIAYKDDYYSRRIILPNSKKDIIAKLTYQLFPQAGKKRDILLMPYSGSTAPGYLNTQWHLLESIMTLQLYADSSEKFLIEQIRDTPELYPHFAVVVDDWGPIPVLLTGLFYDQEIHGEVVKAQIAIHHNRMYRNRSLFMGIYPDRKVFLKSLNGTFGLMMQRYFEDVAVTLFNIGRRSSLIQAIRWSKVVEDLLGQVIQAKLREAIPKPDVWGTYVEEILLDQEEILRCDLFENHGSAILMAQIFRYTVLYFINELYRQLGLEEKSKHYLVRIDETYRSYDALKGEGSSARRISNVEDLQFLNTLREKYQENNPANMSRMRPVGVWQQGLVEFVRLLSHIQEHPVSPTKGRIFISFSHNLPSSEYVKAQIEDYYATHFHDRIEVLSVEDVQSAMTFEFDIRTRIWQSDRLLIIVSADNVYNRYQWLAREAELGLLLGKQINFLLEEGYDKEKLETALENNEMDLLPGATAGFRASLLLDMFRQKPSQSFRIPADKSEPVWQGLDESLQHALDEMGVFAVGSRHKNIILGYLCQFPRNTLVTLKYLHQLVGIGKLLTAKEIETLLYTELGTNPRLPFNTMTQARNAFQNCRNNVRKRNLYIDFVPYSLLYTIKAENTFYIMPALANILRALQPDLSDERILNWGGNLFDEALAL